MASSVPVRSIRSLTRVRRSRTALVRPVDVVGIVVSASPGAGASQHGSPPVPAPLRSNRREAAPPRETTPTGRIGDVDDDAQTIAVLGEVASQRCQRVGNRAPTPGVTRGGGRRSSRARCARRKAYHPVARPGTVSSGNAARAARVAVTPGRAAAGGTTAGTAGLASSDGRCRSQAGLTALMTTTPVTGSIRPTNRRRESTRSRTNARTGPRAGGRRSSAGYGAGAGPRPAPPAPAAAEAPAADPDVRRREFRPP